jgi:hypothetical protein
MRRGLAVHVSLVFLALLGGVATFGPAGIIVGPLALALFLAAIRMWQRSAAAEGAADRPVAGSEGAARREGTPGCLGLVRSHGVAADCATDEARSAVDRRDSDGATLP